MKGLDKTAAELIRSAKRPEFTATAADDRVEAIREQRAKLMAAGFSYMAANDMAVDAYDKVMEI